MSPRYKFIVSINYGENQGQRKIPYFLIQDFLYLSFKIFRLVYEHFGIQIQTNIKTLALKMT